MNTMTRSLNILTVLAVAGLLFAGYMSGVKFFSETCAFGESCPYFLGYPACYYGFAMYLVMTLDLLLVRFVPRLMRAGFLSVATVSFLGILFAGYFTMGELPKLFSEGLGAYLLGLPTCAWGLIVYIAIFAVSLRALRAGGGKSDASSGV